MGQIPFSYKYGLRESDICPIIIVPALIFLAVLIFIPDLSQAKIVEEHIYIVPDGNVEKSVIENIKQKLPGSFPMSVNAVIDPQEDMPQGAYNPLRKQYNVQSISDDISRRITVDVVNERALVITDVDLYMPDLDFVFGFADAKKGICVISLTRLRNEFYGFKPDNNLFIARAVKEAVYELGRSWGLDHCPNLKCVMNFTNSLSDTDRKRNTFCPACQNKLHSRYGKPLLNIKL